MQTTWSRGFTYARRPSAVRGFNEPKTTMRMSQSCRCFCLARWAKPKIAAFGATWWRTAFSAIIVKRHQVKSLKSSAHTLWRFHCHFDIWNINLRVFPMRGSKNLLWTLSCELGGCLLIFQYHWPQQTARHGVACLRVANYSDYFKSLVRYATTEIALRTSAAWSTR